MAVAPEIDTPTVALKKIEFMEPDAVPPIVLAPELTITPTPFARTATTTFERCSTGPFGTRPICASIT